MLMMLFNRQASLVNETLSTEQGDEDLMLAYARGNEKAFEILYSRHKGGTYRYCLRLLTHSHSAEECFQNAWLKLIKSRGQYQVKAKFTTFLYQITHHCVIDWLRKENKVTMVEFDEQANELEYETTKIDQHWILQQNYQLLKQHIEMLPLEQRDVLLLKLEADLSLEEISMIVGVNAETVKSRLRYALGKLRALCGEIA